MNKKTARTTELEEEWSRLTSRLFGISPDPVWQYLMEQRIAALADCRRQVLKDIRLASSLEEDAARIAFAIRDCAGKLVNILMLELEGMGLFANVVRHYRLISKEASIAGASVHFGEPKEELGVAVSVESAIAIVLATKGGAVQGLLRSDGRKDIAGTGDGEKRLYFL